MGGGKSKSKSGQQQSFSNDVWGGQSPYLQSLYGNAQNLWGQQQPGIAGAQGNMNDVYQQMNPNWQNQMQGGAYAGVDANQIMQGLNQSLQAPSQSGKLYGDIMAGQGNAYLGGMQDQVMQNAQDLAAQNMSMLDQRAGMGGMSGSSRHGIAQAQALKDINQGAQNQLTNLGYNTFDKDLQNKLDIAAMADRNTLSRQQMQMDALQQKQNAMQGGLSFGGQMQGAAGSSTFLPWQAMGQYANTIGGPTIVGSGSGSGTSKSKGGGFGLK
jgi:hypothetical protein